MWSLKSSGVHRYQFEHGLLHVAPHVQTLFVPSDDCPGHFDDQPLLYCFLTASAWSTCSSRQFRIEQMTLLLDNITSIPFPPASWLFFWKFPNLPEVRSLWFDPSASQYCELCGTEIKASVLAFCSVFRVIYPSLQALVFGLQQFE
ncbi:hypothetical protein G6F57_014180 [Rhizopus arrhizus]|uniref:Uncharacterized protein n=1 Tax=Rhizopus oryzae TaxID=64495 RepID=A0A9P7BPR0_RHIOR|nr:hypothetical protein G6F23_007646 [Rhizopus arrhizus]KAG0762438.1 hypothetical protein G6F24_006799 [Rhizopus arrhizus]KAG0790130.1 hypothetical protein G6F21_006032 [Rhizopus arrhizus]KAG0798694.1 hypothetical protein G6F22_003966 [Rhizopus arrhizus]KAG0810648.1 hypothetical protein G6F20_007793 [Rhizopus arrhizus]